MHTVLFSTMNVARQKDQHTVLGIEVFFSFSRISLPPLYRSLIHPVTRWQIDKTLVSSEEENLTFNETGKSSSALLVFRSKLTISRIDLRVEERAQVKRRRSIALLSVLRQRLGRQVRQDSPDKVLSGRCSLSQCTDTYRISHTQALKDASAWRCITSGRSKNSV